MKNTMHKMGIDLFDWALVEGGCGVGCKKEGERHLTKGKHCPRRGILELYSECTTEKFISDIIHSGDDVVT